MLLGALEKRAPKIPRRLGVAPGMLKWVSDQMPPEQARSAEELFDALMGMAEHRLVLHAEGQGVL